MYPWNFAFLYSAALWWAALTLPGLNIRRLFGLVLELVLPWGCNTCAHKLLKHTVATSGARLCNKAIAFNLVLLDYIQHNISQLFKLKARTFRTLWCSVDEQSWDISDILSSTMVGTSTSPRAPSLRHSSSCLVRALFLEDLFHYCKSLPFFYFLTFEKAECSIFALLVGWLVGWLVGRRHH